MTSIITYPSASGFPGFVSYTLNLGRKSTVMRSPFTGKRQTNNFAYAVWNFTGKYSLTDKANANLMRSFLAQLEGQANAFRFSPPEYVSPSTGYAGAAGLVNGASQTGKSLITDGWTASAAVFKAGDFFTVNDEFKVLTADATANGSGQVTLAFEPALRASPADNAALTIVNPTILLCSTDDTAATWDLSPPILYQFQLNAIECIE
jgi:hypothetical protein